MAPEAASGAGAGAVAGWAWAAQGRPSAPLAAGVVEASAAQGSLAASMGAGAGTSKVAADAEALAWSTWEGGGDTSGGEGVKEAWGGTGEDIPWACA